MRFEATVTRRLLLQGRSAIERLSPGRFPVPASTLRDEAEAGWGDPGLGEAGSGAPGSLRRLGRGHRAAFQGKTRAVWGETPGGQVGGRRPRP